MNHYTIMDFLLSKYGLIFTEFDSIDRGGAGCEGFRGTRIYWKRSFPVNTLYGLTISGHVTVLRQWLLEKNTDYIINYNMCFIGRHEA